MKHLTALVVLLAAFASIAESYKILCLFPFQGKSHFIMFDPLCKALAKRGHEVHMISHFPQKSPVANFTDIVNLSDGQDIINSLSLQTGNDIQNNLIYIVTDWFGERICDLMKLPDMQKFIKNPPKVPYDLIITEYFYAPCYIGFGNFLNAPVALALSSAEMPFIDEIMGSPVNHAYHPSLYVEKAVLTTFWDRLLSFYENTKNSYFAFWYTEVQTEMMRKYLGPNIPDIRTVEKSVSLVLVNTYMSFQGIRSLTPSIVEVGGLHVEQADTKISPELTKWLDAADEGVVYFSMGSLINMSTFSNESLRSLYTSLGKIAPVKVLMRTPKGVRHPDTPSNVLTQSWIPQVPVLKHKNTKVFISHGGLMGSQEALYYGVPVIGIPIFADQHRNINLFVHKNMGVRINANHITEKDMDAALNAVLNDPKYRESAKRESRLFRDRPMKPLDTAIFWLEYIIRNGPNSLRAPSMDMPWWQLNLLDVIAFILGCFAIVIAAVFFLLRLILKNFQKDTITEKKHN